MLTDCQHAPTPRPSTPKAIIFLANGQACEQGLGTVERLRYSYVRWVQIVYGHGLLGMCPTVRTVLNAKYVTWSLFLLCFGQAL